MTVEVTLDIHSGLPNPRWYLHQNEIDRLRELLPSLARSPANRKRRPPDLGYRGFHITVLGEEDLPTSISVYAGFVETDDGVYLDDNRKFEKWLLDTGKATIEKNTQEFVRRELLK